MLLAVVKMPPDVGALARAAEATGIAAADVSLRLAGTPPRVLLADTDGAAVTAAANALERAGFGVLTCDPTDAPGDRDRIVARSLELESGGLVAIDGQDGRHACPAGAIELFQRGVRIAISTETVRKPERAFAIGRAILTGGLVLSKEVLKTSVKQSEARDPFLVVQRSDGGPEIILYERRMNYRFLGAGMQPTSFGNLERTLARLQAIAPGAPYDDRVSRPGFVDALPSTSADDVDLALLLVRLSCRRYPGR